MDGNSNNCFQLWHRLLPVLPYSHTCFSCLSFWESLAINLFSRLCTVRGRRDNTIVPSPLFPSQLLQPLEAEEEHHYDALSATTDPWEYRLLRQYFHNVLCEEHKVPYILWCERVCNVTVVLHLGCEYEEMQVDALWLWFISLVANGSSFQVNSTCFWK